MAVGRVSALDLTRQVQQRDDLLRAGREVAQPDLARGQLIADDDREVCVVARRGLELLAELSTADLGAGRNARRAQICGDLQSSDRVVGVRADDDGDRSRLRRDGRAGLGEGDDEPVDAEPEADAGSGPPGEELDEAAAAAAAADRLLLSLAPGDVELERGSRVVVETA